MDAARLAQLIADHPAVAASDDGMSVITTVCRLSFVHFDKPYAKEGTNREPRFQCVVIIPAESDLKPLITAAGIAWQESPLAKKQPKSNPIKKQADMLAEGYEGFGSTGYFINCDTKTQPSLFDLDIQPVDHSKFYSGVWARVKVRAQAYDVGGNNGVKFWLQSVQKFDDDKKLGGGGNAADGFSRVGAAPAGNGAASAPPSAAAAFGLPS